MKIIKETQNSKGYAQIETKDGVVEVWHYPDSVHLQAEDYTRGMACSVHLTRKQWKQIVKYIEGKK